MLQAIIKTQDASISFRASLTSIPAPAKFSMFYYFLAFFFTTQEDRKWDYSTGSGELPSGELVCKLYPLSLSGFQSRAEQSRAGEEGFGEIYLGRSRGLVCSIWPPELDPQLTALELPWFTPLQDWGPLCFNALSLPAALPRFFPRFFSLLCKKKKKERKMIIA